MIIFAPERILAVAFVMTLAAIIASADDGRPALVIQKPEGWITMDQAFKGVVIVAPGLQAETVRIRYTLHDATGEISAIPDKKDMLRFRFEIPPVANAAPGLLTLHAAASFDKVNEPAQSSAALTIPVALEQELDITGDAAVALLYPIGGPEYTVRYVPCCNIFGGITMATRVPVNPEKNSTGLPEKILSDFMILAPDGLSASTMGMYMDFLLGPDRFKGVTPALYEFNGRAWVEFSSYEVDAARGYLSMHCPDGGTFVIAAKP